jgi:hypothetical protein
MVRFSSVILAFGALVARVAADHSITVINQCGYGTPTMYGPSTESPFQNVRSSHSGIHAHEELMIDQGPINVAGGYYTTSDLRGAIIYLQTGRCGQNGEVSRCYISRGQEGDTTHQCAQNCLAVEVTLISTGGSVDITRIPPHAYDQPVSFALWPDNQGAVCESIFEMPGEVLIHSTDLQ